MPRVRVAHITDPGCPFAYGGEAFVSALRWRFGDQLDWRLVMIGLTEDASQYEARGYTPLRGALGQARFRSRYGMPFAAAPKPRHSWSRLKTIELIAPQQGLENLLL